MQRNAIILAAGTASRFVPLSQECPKGLLEVKGEILIERQIRQLQQAGIPDICVVVGYMAGRFDYLRERFGVELVYNGDYARYNNTSSMIRVLDRLGDTYICSSDNYFPENVFKGEPTHSFYSALYASGETSEYCMKTDVEDNITDISIGGHDAWYMVGHVYFSRDFSEKFKNILKVEYEKEETRLGYWEDIYIKQLDKLPHMKINRYEKGLIQEFDSLDELRAFDSSYLDNTRSRIIKGIAEKLGCREGALSMFRKESGNSDHLRFSFQKDKENYLYDSADKSVTRS